LRPVWIGPLPYRAERWVCLPSPHDGRFFDLLRRNPSASTPRCEPASLKRAAAGNCNLRVGRLAVQLSSGSVEGAGARQVFDGLRTESEGLQALAPARAKRAASSDPVATSTLSTSPGLAPRRKAVSRGSKCLPPALEGEDFFNDGLKPMAQPSRGISATGNLVGSTPQAQ
jgi:hypothetical protein